LGLIFGLFVSLGAIACGPEFEPSSELSSLRILAVKKDDPYVRVAAPPGGDGPADENASGEYQPDNVVELTVALSDSRRKSERGGALQKLWFAGCSNPPGDTYFSCVLSVWLAFKAYDAIGPKPLADGETWGLSDANTTEVLRFVQDAFPDLMSGAGGSASLSDEEQQQLIEQALALRVGAGDSFRYEVPSWLIDRHPRSSDPDVPSYGMTQVYFAVCDGEIELAEPWQGEIDPFTVLADATRGFPLTCVDRKTKKQRGPENFVVSYSNVYAYESLSNRNPKISGMKLDSKAVDESALCIGEACELAVDACDNPKAPRYSRCEEEKAADCPVVEVLSGLKESDNAETDVTATLAGKGGNTLREQMWIRYYADRGAIKNEAKRLQDANDGWFSDHGTEWKVPRTAGPVSLWTVVYDNRGGVDWVRTGICVVP
jgi:hypothetical protein